MPSTIKLHRVFKTKPERLYKAFITPEAMVKWLPPHGFVGKVHAIDARVGGSYKMSFTNLGTGATHSFGGEYLELVPGKRIVHTDKFDSGLEGTMKVTIDIRPVLCGAEVNIVQDGVPDAIPAEMCYLGWGESLELLKLLVEPEIPDQG